MTNEVIITEYRTPNVVLNGQINDVLGPIITSQVITTGNKSEATNAKTTIVQIDVKSNAGAAVWVKVGDSSVSAAANTAGNIYIPKGGNIKLNITGGQYIDTATDT